MNPWKWLGGKSPRTMASRRASRTTLQCERLEEREVPANGPSFEINPTALNGYELNQTLQINGTPNDDVITVAPNPFNTLLVTIRTTGLGVVPTETTQIHPGGWRVRRLVIDAGAGNDKVYNNTAIPSTIYGRDGYDALYGGSSGDILHTGDNNSGSFMAWNPAVQATPPNDFAYGRGGNDTLYGGAFSDQLFGGDGSDTLYGGDFGDFLHGGTGIDYFYGEGGDDFLHAGDDLDMDQISTGSGYDQVHPTWHLIAGSNVKHIDDLITDFNQMEDTLLWLV